MLFSPITKITLSQFDLDYKEIYWLSLLNIERESKFKTDPIQYVELCFPAFLLALNLFMGWFNLHDGIKMAFTPGLSTFPSLRKSDL